MTGHSEIRGQDIDYLTCIAGNIMKQSIQFWFASGIALCCVATTSPTHAQSITHIGVTHQENTSINLWKFVDITKLLVPRCSAQAASKFIITGRGGLPPNPTEPLRSDAVRVDLGTPVQGEENRSSAAISSNPTTSSPDPIVEAQGWVIGNKGEVVLTVQAPTVTPHSPWLTVADCHAPQNSS